MISVLCPTRNRDKDLDRMAYSLFNRSKGAVELLTYKDADDTAPGHVPHGARSFVGEAAQTVGEAWNFLASQANGDLLMMGNDDLIFRTNGWDVQIQEAVSKYSDGIFCAWANDGLNFGRHCAFPIVSRRWYETLGYFTPDCFNFLYHDTWIHDIGKRVDRCCYIGAVLVEHMHYSASKSKYDETYKRHREGKLDYRDVDKVKFANTIYLRETDALRIMEVMSTVGVVL